MEIEENFQGEPYEKSLEKISIWTIFIGFCGEDSWEQKKIEIIKNYVKILSKIEKNQKNYTNR